MRGLSIALLLLLPLLPLQMHSPAEDVACNGMVELCERRYSEVTFPETHNAHSTLDAGFIILAANHRSNILNQYDAGVRAFMIDAHHAHPDKLGMEDTAFCHGGADTPFHPCAYGSWDAAEMLSLLHDRMNETPRDVVTLLIEVHVPYTHLDHILWASGLHEKLHVQPLGASWPTLGEMVESGRRLVVFIEGAADAAHPHLHDFGTHGWTTDYAETSPDQMVCDHHRGDAAAPIWHLNNWIADEVGLSDYTAAPTVNAYEFLLGRALDCWQVHGHRPTFIAVDWWTDGEVVNVTRTLNAMEHWSHPVPPRSTTD